MQDRLKKRTVSWVEYSLACQAQRMMLSAVQSPSGHKLLAASHRLFINSLAALSKFMEDVKLGESIWHIEEEGRYSEEQIA